MKKAPGYPRGFCYYLLFNNYIQQYLFPRVSHVHIQQQQQQHSLIWRITFMEIDSNRFKCLAFRKSQPYEIQK